MRLGKREDTEQRGKPIESRRKVATVSLVLQVAIRLMLKASALSPSSAQLEVVTTTRGESNPWACLPQYPVTYRQAQLLQVAVIV